MNINPNYIIKKNILTICKYTKIQQNGIDITINEKVNLGHGKSKCVCMNEAVKIPKNMFAMIFHRSSFNRQGIFMMSGLWDSGFVGRIGLTIYNLSGKTIYIPKNERVAQIVFFKAKAASLYNGQYQNDTLKEISSI